MDSSVGIRERCPAVTTTTTPSAIIVASLLHLSVSWPEARATTQDTHEAESKFHGYALILHNESILTHLMQPDFCYLHQTYYHSRRGSLSLAK